MADNRRRMPSSAYLKEEMTEAGDVALAYPSGAWALCALTAGRAGRAVKLCWHVGQTGRGAGLPHRRAQVRPCRGS